jgi:hypothetical protein
MSEDKKAFTVKDRRHFATDGAPRPEVPAEDEAQARPIDARSEERRPEGHPVDFSGFVLSLGAQAAGLLGGEPDEGLSPADRLAAARSIISVLEMLKDKTEGRRTTEEDKVLDGLLYELRMGYVGASRT